MSAIIKNPLKNSRIQTAIRNHHQNLIIYSLSTFPENFIEIRPQLFELFYKETDARCQLQLPLTGG